MKVLPAHKLWGALRYATSISTLEGSSLSSASILFLSSDPARHGPVVANASS